MRVAHLILVCRLNFAAAWSLPDAPNKRFRSEVREPCSRSGDAGSTEHVSTGPEYEPNWLVCLCSSQGWH